MLPATGKDTRLGSNPVIVRSDFPTNNTKVWKLEPLGPNWLFGSALRQLL